MRDTQGFQMTMEVLVMGESLVLLADDHADKHALGDRLGVTLRKGARTDGPECRLIAAIHPSEQFLGLEPARPRGTFEFGLQRSGAGERNRAEELGILEAQPGGPVSAHAETIE